MVATVAMIVVIYCIQLKDDCGGNNVIGGAFVDFVTWGVILTQLSSLGRNTTWPVDKSR